MAAEDEPPSISQIELVRNSTKKKLSIEGEELFDNRDVDKLMSDDGYLSRFWIHAFFIPGERVENTTNLVIDTFKWRKEFGVNDITESDLDMEILNRGSLYYHNRDKKGSRLLGKLKVIDKFIHSMSVNSNNLWEYIVEIYNNIIFP